MLCSAVYNYDPDILDGSGEPWNWPTREWNLFAGLTFYFLINYAARQILKHVVGPGGLEPPRSGY